ncbi:hypothetical protein OsI_36630 [Oryza sativa Indica Group]|jgi:hypothetical protein|uniref:Uncharacterized protein n=1 Tax=Oryza sativa subsp. indica TaxID=39946 RepID=A2ZFS5_ORYSI|nr:hypothetical protein OsI_36630 [Oryza sativa Indica Group]
MSAEEEEGPTTTTTMDPNDAAVPTPAAAAVAAGDEKKPPAGKVPMPDDYIATILSLKREPPPKPEYLSLLSPEEREKQLEFDAVCAKEDDALEELEAKILAGLRKDGYYLVDESFLEKSAAMRAYVSEEWAKMDWAGSGIIFGDWDYDDPQCVQYL